MIKYRPPYLSMYVISYTLHAQNNFHLFQTINHKLKVDCRRNKINGKERDHIYENALELKNCFKQNSKQEAIEQFKQYLQNYMTISVVLKDFIRKHIINHFHRYVEHLDDENIKKHRIKLKITTDKPIQKK